MKFLAKVFSGSHSPRRLLGRPEAQDLADSRLPYLLGALLFWALLLQMRLVFLQVIEHRHYQARADRQHMTDVKILPVRGDIRDRRGGNMAISLKAESLFCTPSSFYPKYQSGKTEQDKSWGEPDRKAAHDVATKLSPILDMSPRILMDRLLRKKPFVWIARQLSSSKANAIRDLNLDGVDFLPESRRHYPRGSLACQLLGFTNIDGQGQLGIEQKYNEQLAGKAGSLLAPRDARGHLLLLQENFKEIPANGSTLQLTIDSTIQHIVEDALADGVRLSKPTTAYAVVVDPNTGEVLAMAGTPTFDPNHVLPRHLMNRSESELSFAEKEELRREQERQKAARKVHPVEDSYEPGSTMKIFTAAIALEERKVHLGEQIDCGPGRWVYSKNLTVTDTHRHGVLSFEDVLCQSSNIGTAKIGLRISPAIHYQYLRKFGFGEPTGLNFPGETAGRLIAPDRWSGTTQPTMCYGYGLSTSPLQILMAACVLANGGKLLQPFIVQKIYNDQGVLLKEFKPNVRDPKVISEETAAMMREVLKGVITHGTAKKAKLDATEAFGKTGTARKIINGQYDPKRHFASFLGFFPADNPQYGMLFMLDDPMGDVTGGDVAAPLFKKIGDAIMRYRNSDPATDQDPDLKLSLRDWPVSETDEAVIHVEIGKVPDLRGLSLKAAIHRVVLAGGVPKVEGLDEGSQGAYVVNDQNPEPGAPLELGKSVKLRLRGP